MDLFGRQDQVLNGGLSSDGMFVTWPSLATVTNGGVGLLIQQTSFDYRQPVRRIFEIGPGVIPVGFFGLTVNVDASFCDGSSLTPDQVEQCQYRAQPTYYIIGRPEGSLQMGRFVGPNALSTCFYRTYGNPCGSNDMILSGKAGCNATDASAKKMTWTLNGVLLNGVSVDLNGQEMVIQEKLTAMFVGLNIAIQGDTQQC